jgi:hypothetical protein
LIRRDASDRVLLEMRIDYDRLGRETGVRFFGASEEPITLPQGWHEQRSVYNRLGHEVAREYYDTSGNLTMTQGGYAVRLARYDTRGRMSQLCLLDAQRKPVVSSETGSCCIRYAYDVQGRMTKISHFDTADKPMISSKGYHARRMQYDRWGNEVFQEFLDTREEVMINPLQGCAKIVRKTDDMGRITEVRYLDTQGELTMNVQGFARAVATHDGTGRREVRYYDAQGREISAP